MADYEKGSFKVKIDNTELSLSTLQTISITLYFIVFFIGIIGNVIIIWFVWFKAKVTHSLLFWIFVMAISDLIFCLFLPVSIHYIYNGYNWTLGAFMCKITSFVSMFASCFKTWVLFIICLDLFIRITEKMLVLLVTCYMVCGILIFMSIVFAVSTFYFEPNVLSSDGSKQCCDWSYTTGKDSILSDAENNLLFSIRFLIGFIVPLIMIIICVILIIRKMKQEQDYSIYYLIKSLVIIVLVHFICLFPYKFVSLIAIFIHEQFFILKNLADVITLCSSLYFMSFCLNWIIFMIVGNPQRTLFYKNISNIMGLAMSESFPTHKDYKGSSSSEDIPMRSTSRMDPLENVEDLPEIV
ncbi:putative G-protein-coupled receptor-like protein [Namao virus]|nr:putative G-protein-coupled receptor-like protein [Namao virus]